MLAEAVEVFLEQPQSPGNYDRLVTLLREHSSTIGCIYGFPDEPEIPKGMPFDLVWNLKSSASVLQQVAKTSNPNILGLESVVEMAYLCTYCIHSSHKAQQ